MQREVYVRRQKLREVIMRAARPPINAINNPGLSRARWIMPLAAASVGCAPSKQVQVDSYLQQTVDGSPLYLILIV